MGFGRTLGMTSGGWTSAGVLLLALGGCAALPPNSFLDPTRVGRFGGDAQETWIRQVLTPLDTPPGLPHATEPTAEDLVAQYEEYRIAPGDVLSLTINDLLGDGAPYAVAVEVNPLGEIRIPELGSIKVAGLTEAELEQEITARLKEAGLLPRPIVLVFVQTKRGRVFNMVGAIGRPGPYPIVEPDMRLLDAVAMAGDVSATAQRLYVIRRTSAAGGPAAPERREAAPPVEKEGWVIPPPVIEEPPAPASLARGGPLRPQDQAPPDEPAREDLADVLAPPGSQTRPAAQRAEPVTEPAFPPLIFDPATGQVLEAAPRRAAPPAGVEPAEPALPEELEEPFDWEDVKELALEQRVIAVPVAELKAGNPRYNIVVRSRDVINVPVDTGVFYVMGEVIRPGVYAFGGRDITVKQAIAIVGGFSALAWPQRCEVIRREPGTDKQRTIPVNLDAIFAGLEPDFYLRDDDILNVGTHIIAPFLFVVRNSFRFTYGFGFVYDRNFADKDAYSSRANPESIAQARRARRGLPF